MSLKIGEEQVQDRIEDGSYPVRLVQVIDIGLQEKIDFDTNQPTGSYHPRAILTWEFPTERIEVDGEDRPRWLSQEVTISYHERAKLPQIIQALDPQREAETLVDLLGRPALSTVASTKNNKPKIASIVQLPKSLQVGELENDPVAFDMDDFDNEIFNSLPDWLKNRIKEAKNYPFQDQEGVGGDDDAPAEFDDDIPF